jgi:hypothetical protein
MKIDRIFEYQILFSKPPSKTWLLCVFATEITKKKVTTFYFLAMSRCFFPFYKNGEWHKNVMDVP